MEKEHRATETAAAPVAGRTLILEQIHAELGIDDLHAYAEDGTLPLEIPVGLAIPETYRSPSGGDQLIALDRASGRGLYALMGTSDDCLPAGSTGWKIRNILERIDEDDLTRWKMIEAIASYTDCCYGDEGDEPGEIRVMLETAQTSDGLDVYRWHDHDGAGSYDSGDIMLDQDAVIRAGRAHAEEQDETPDLDVLIDGILTTGYFGPLCDAGDVRRACQAATEYSQGYLMLAPGEPPRDPIGVAWTTNGYLQVPHHIQLAATHSRIEYAADALLRAIRTAMREEEPPMVTDDGSCDPLYGQRREALRSLFAAMEFVIDAISGRAA
jgi:hypothetical protein